MEENTFSINRNIKLWEKGWSSEDTEWDNHDDIKKDVTAATVDIFIRHLHLCLELCNRRNQI